MGTQPNELPPQFYDPKHVELVKKIAEKTRRQKILWNKTSTGMNAYVTGKLEIGFVRELSLIGGSEWKLFTIRGTQGNEILKIHNKRMLTLGQLVSGRVADMQNPFLAGDPLTNAISELYQIVEETSKGEVEKVIDVIDNI